MKSSNEMYKKLTIPSNHRYAGLFRHDPLLAKQVAFSPNMRIPFHRWFYYKPGFSCGIVSYLRDRFMQHRERITAFDPFCGVGTVPLWAFEQGQKGVGSDISPLAIFISKCKSVRSADERLLHSDLEMVRGKASEILQSNQDRGFISEVPYYIQKGFDEKERNRLLALIKAIDTVESVDNKYLLTLSLMRAAYDVSLTKKDGGFLRYIERSKFSDIDKRHALHLEDMLRDFRANKQTKLIDGVGNNTLATVWPEFHVMDARKLDFNDDSFNFIVTSPPYLNRYDYTRIYAIEMNILGLSDSEIRAIRRNTVKSHVEADSRQSREMKSDIFDEAYEALTASELSNPGIPSMVNGYYSDLTSCLLEMKRVTSEDRSISLVLGNSRFSGIHFETDSIVAEIGENIGLEPREIIVTKFRGSSAQQIARYGDSQLRESVVVF